MKVFPFEHVLIDSKDSPENGQAEAPIPKDILM